MKEINRIHTPYRGDSPYIFISYSHKDFKNGKSRGCRQIFMYGRKIGERASGNGSLRGRHRTKNNYVQEKWFAKTET